MRSSMAAWWVVAVSVLCENTQGYVSRNPTARRSSGRAWRGRLLKSVELDEAGKSNCKLAFRLAAGAAALATGTAGLTSYPTRAEEPLPQIGATEQTLQFELPTVQQLDAPDLAELNAISGFSHDALVFLAATVVVTPLSRILNISPILGYLVAGVALGPSGLNAFQDLKVDDSLAECGVLFLLFEQGLELTVDRLQKLRRYTFGLGFLQLVLCTLAFGAFPFVGGVQFLERFVGAKPELVAITRPDEAIIIGAALTLSSSAFVLRLLQEKRQADEEFALACLGVLLLQDIAVVPILVLLPIIEDTQVLGFDADIRALSVSALQSLAALAFILFIGRIVLRRVFAAIAGAQSSEAFVALCLLVVLGTGALTDAAGLSSTLGAFVSGALLAETQFGSRIEADLQPFRGLLLGLFFVTTGTNVDVALLIQEWPTACALIIGLLTFKAAIVAFFARFTLQLERTDAVRVALLLAGGGEFAFVVLTLATRLDVLQPQLAKLDTAVVVITMALTPFLASLGDSIAAADHSNASTPEEKSPLPQSGAPASVVFIHGFGPLEQTVATLLTEGAPQAAYVAVDDSPAIVAEARARGFPVAFGDASPALVASILDGREASAFFLPTPTANDVRQLRQAYPNARFVATSLHGNDDKAGPTQLLAAGCDVVVDGQLETALHVGRALLEEIAPNATEVDRIMYRVRAKVETRAERMSNRPGFAKSTVSGGGIDLDPSKKFALSPGTRAKAAKQLQIFAGYDDDGRDEDNGGKDDDGNVDVPSSASG